MINNKNNSLNFCSFEKKSIFFALIFVSGCVSLPKEQQTENLIAPPSLETSMTKGVESGFFHLGEFPKENWWETFHSTELNALITEALLQDPTLQSAEKRVEFAKQTAKITRSKLFPLLFFDADETWQYLSKNGLYRTLNPKIPLNANLVDLTLSFQYEFDFWGKNKNLFDAALGEKKAQEAEAAGVKLITTTSIAQGYFALKTNLIRKSLYEELYAVRKGIWDLQCLLQDKALLSKFEPLLSEEELFEAEKGLLGISEEVETNRHLINILVGKGPDAPLCIEESLPCPLKALPLPDQLSTNLLARRPDLMAQIWRVEALAHEVGAAKADFYPNINLTALAGLESVLYRKLFKAQSQTGALEPAIHLPIFTAGAIRANLRAKKALFDAAVFDYNALILQSAAEVADLVSLGKAIFAQMADQEKIVTAAKERESLTILRASNGLDNLLSLYAVKQELILKKLDEVSLLYSQYLTAIKLIKALGGGYQSEYAIPLSKKEKDA